MVLGKEKVCKRSFTRAMRFQNALAFQAGLARRKIHRAWAGKKPTSNQAAE